MRSMTEKREKRKVSVGPSVGRKKNLEEIKESYSGRDDRVEILTGKRDAEIWF